ncbi:MAG TPA: hypothetical protein VF204_06425 [Streptosporangiaceae bacterium]
MPEPAAGLPNPALVVLIGAAGSGKSSWAGPADVLRLAPVTRAFT